jgi:hypothetical protein
MGVVCVLEEHRDVDIARLANSVDKVVVKEKKRTRLIEMFTLRT